MDYHRKMAHTELLHRIGQSDQYEMDDILHAVRNRYKELHPDTDFVIVSIPQNDPEERTALWRWLVDYVRNHEISKE